MLPRAEEDAPDSPRDTSLCEGGVNGRKPSRLLFTADRFSVGRDSVGLDSVLRDALSLRDSPTVEFDGEVRVLLAFGGVNGRYAPRFPFSADEVLALRLAELFTSRFELLISRFD